MCTIYYINSICVCLGSFSFSFLDFYFGSGSKKIFPVLIQLNNNKTIPYFYSQLGTKSCYSFFFFLRGWEGATDSKANTQIYT